ncbi:MAG: flagellar hook protein FlgE [Emcibacteraceae bacterium]|nr:flagellar hook protein FlgE [Emcibacteraceae bacterium]
MSLYASLFSGVSGLSANSSAMGMISDNIVNINTIGYKGTQAKFSSLVTESNSSSYSPGGVIAKPQALISHQGLLQGSTSATDLSIDGAGFFVVSNQTDSQDANSTISYTRAGSFTPDDNGFLQNTAGLYLQGYELDSDGNAPTVNIGNLKPINVSNFTITAEATTSVAIRANLQSSQAISPAVTGATYTSATVAGSMAGYDADVSQGIVPATQGTKPDFQTNTQVYDAKGGLHTVTFAALKQADNLWNVEIFISPPNDLSTQPLAGTGQLASGQIAFNGDGSIDTAGTSPALLAALTVNWSGGADPGQITFNLGTDGQSDGISEFAGESTVISTTSNGAKFGSVIGVSVKEEGIVTALFNNGLARDVFILPISTFQNPDGLTRRQGNSYTISDASGSGDLKLAGKGGAGFVAPSTLEASTVDLAQEFTNLITIQRAFSASTKIITTADEMLTELNNIKR